MKSFIRKQITRFVTDAPSKIIYDIVKWGCVSLIGIIVLNWLLIGDWLAIEHTFTKLTIILSTITIALIVALIVGWVFKSRIEEIKNDSMIDELTGLKNYKALKLHLEDKLEESKRKKSNLSVILIDVDDFKHFNTEFGFETADLLLKELGKLLSKDGRFTDETFRYHLKGDEFVVVASDTNIGQADIAAGRKRELIEKLPVKLNGITKYFTVSCGSAQATSSSDYETILNKAHEALERAKARPGKNANEYAI